MEWDPDDTKYIVVLKCLSNSQMCTIKLEYLAIVCQFFFLFVFTYSLINQLKPGIIKRVNRLSTPIAGLVSVNIFTDLTVWVFLKGSLAVWCISNNAEDLCEYLTYVDNCNG